MKPKKICICLLVTILLCLVALVGCEDPVASKEESWKQPLSLEPLPLNADSGKFEEEGDLQGALEELYKMCSNQPETLASTVSAFPSIMEAAGFSGETTAEAAQEIDDFLSNDEHGGATQDALLKMLGEVLESPYTESRFTERTGKVDMLYMYQVDEEQPVTPANMRLVCLGAEPWGAYPCLEITVRQNGNENTGIFYLPGGFQRIISR